VLSNERRRDLRFKVTTNPTAEWTTRQLVEAFAWTSAPRYLLRDHDLIYGYLFERQVEALGMEDREHRVSRCGVNVRTSR
jgi:hypothetical protein